MALLDNLFSRFGAKRVSPTQTVGAPGTSVIGGYVQNNEKATELQGTQKYITYSDILANTSIVAAGTRYFLNLLGKAEWKVIAVDDTPAAIEAQEFLEDVMDDMQTPWNRAIRRAAMYRFYGFSLQEWTAKKRESDGMFGMLDVAPRAQNTIERWSLEDTGAVDGVIQRNPQNSNEIFLPRSKLIYLVDDTLNDSPEGLGLFRHLVEPAKKLKRYEQLEGFGFESDLRGVPIGRVPLAALDQKVKDGDITPEDRDASIAVITQFIKNHIKNPELGMTLDSQTYLAQDEAARPTNVPLWDIDLLTTDGVSAQGEVAGAIERINRELARVLSVENLLMGGDGAGSLALSRDKSNNFYMVVDSTLSEVREAYQNDYVDTLWKLNGFDEEMKPKLQTESIQFRDIDQITSSLRDMAQAGAILAPDDPAINEVREMLKLSPQPELANMLDSVLQSTNASNPAAASMGGDEANEDDDLPSASGKEDE